MPKWDNPCEVEPVKTGIGGTLVVSRKKAIATLGIVFAIAGGIAWFYMQFIPAAMLWGVAVLIILKLNKRKKS